MPQFFEGLQAMESDSLQKILVSLMNPDGIELKTEIELTMPMAQLFIFAGVLESEGVPDLPKIIRDFIKQYQLYQVSRNREGRREIIAALTEGLKEERKLRDKLTTEPGSV